MARFYFDIHDDENIAVDREGLSLPSLKAARDAAIDVLPDLAREVLPDGDQHTFVARVRDDTGKVVVEAKLSLVIKYF